MSINLKIAPVLTVLFAIPCLGQMTTEQAMARLKQRQAAHAASRPTTETATPDLKAMLDFIVSKANSALETPTDGLTTARIEEMEKYKADTLSSLSNSAVGRTIPCTLTIVDITHAQGDDNMLIAVGNVEIPVPEQVVESWKQRIAQINAEWDYQISGTKSRLSNRLPQQQSDDSLVRNQIAALQKRRATAIADEIASRKVPTAVIYISGGRELLRLRRGSKSRFDSIQLDSMGFQLWNWSNRPQVGPNGEMTGADFAELLRESAAQVSGQTIYKPTPIHFNFVGELDVQAHVLP